MAQDLQFFMLHLHLTSAYGNIIGILEVRL